MYFYTPCDDPKPITLKALFCMQRALKLLRASNRILPHGCTFNTSDLFIGIDTNMTTDSGVLGYTRFFSDTILLSPTIASMLEWDNDNEAAMNVVTHELTHKAQMGWLGGLLWPFLNAPLIAQLTIKPWACANGLAAQEILADEYEFLH